MKPGKNWTATVEYNNWHLASPYDALYNTSSTALSIDPVNGASDDMYFGSVTGNASVRAYWWPESGTLLASTLMRAPTESPSLRICAT